MSMLGRGVPDNKVHGAYIGPTWVLSAPDGPPVCPMNLAIRGIPVIARPIPQTAIAGSLYQYMLGNFKNIDYC